MTLDGWIMTCTGTRAIRRTAIGSMMLAAAMLIGLVSAQAPDDRAASAATPDLTGIYEAVPSGTTLPNGVVTPAVDLTDIALLPAAAAEAEQRDLKKDPARMCQIVGPFRMMARAATKFEILLSPTPPIVYVLFEDIALGSQRQFYLGRGHMQEGEVTIDGTGQEIPAGDPLWLGDSVGRWEGDTLVVDSVDFNEHTWLNGRGAPHSEELKLVERYRPILGGSYLEVTVTAEDPVVLATPFTYTRHYRKVTTELQEHICEPDLSNVSESRHEPPSAR